LEGAVVLEGHMIELIRDLVLHKGYANAAILAAVAQSAAARADGGILALLGHVLVANRFWASSIAGEAFDVNAERRAPQSFESLVDRFRDLQSNEEAWVARATDAELDRQITGPLVPGGGCTVAQAIVQVCLHSLGHRSQCATLLRQHAVVPPTTDFILWLRDRPAASWPPD
jgi:uncharacterized damage-inducible protein DinB